MRIFYKTKGEILNKLFDHQSGQTADWLQMFLSSVWRHLIGPDVTHSRDVNDELKTQNTGVRKSFVIRESQKGIRTDIIIKYGLILSGQLLNSDRREIWHRTRIKSAETVFYWKKIQHI